MNQPSFQEICQAIAERIQAYEDQKFLFEVETSAAMTPEARKAISQRKRQNMTRFERKKHWQHERAREQVYALYAQYGGEILKGENQTVWWNPPE